MYSPDLDIVVKTANPRKSAVLALNKCVETKLVQKLEFGDFVTYPRQGRPEGYILVLKPYIKDVRWEVEIWFLKSVNKGETHINKITKAITKESRLEILKRKHARAKSNMYTDSFDIYKDVLDIELELN